MNVYPVFAVLVLLTSCATRPRIEQEPVTTHELVDKNSRWMLVSPAPAAQCQVWLSFTENNKVIMGYKGIEYEGYFETDSVLTQYITLDIFHKQGWDTACAVNPGYLSLYDVDTQFAYTLLDNRLYFKKAEKVMVFERVTKTPATVAYTR